MQRGETIAGLLNSLPRQGTDLLTGQVRDEMRHLLKERQTRAGGFPDRAGTEDVYYTLFGFLLAEALEEESVLSGIRSYILDKRKLPFPGGVDLFCMAILSASLFPGDPRNHHLAAAIRKELTKKNPETNLYTPFLAGWSLLLLQDPAGAFRAVKKWNSFGSGAVMPCTATAARMIMDHLQKRDSAADRGNKTDGQKAWPEPLPRFYRQPGGFAALENTTEADLLSTAAALTALRMSGSDLRLIRSDCFGFINSLFRDGGFAAVVSDPVADTEYSFYGLLALGALNPEKTT